MARTKESLYCAVDVGTTKVGTLVGRVSPAGTVEVVALGHVSSSGMKKGMVVSPDELAESVRRSADEARRMLGRRLPPAYVGITGSYLTCLNASASLPVARKRRSVVSQRDVDRLLNATSDKAVDRRHLIHVIPRSYTVDGLNEVHNPVGLSGQQLSSESHVVIGDPAPMENLARVVRSAGVTVKGLVIEHLASSEAVLSADERQTGVVLVDVGGGTSDIAIFKDGAIWHTAALPVGGWQYTNDLSLALGVTLAAAEQAKLRYGSAIVDGVGPNDTLDIPIGEGSTTKSVQSTSFYGVLHDRSVDLVRLILHKVKEAGLDRMPPAGMVITGGTSNLPGLLEVAAEYTSCAVRQGSPSHALGLPQELEDAAFATTVGLLLWGIRRRHPKPFTGGAVSVSVPAMQRLREWLSRFGFRRPKEMQA